MFGCPQRSNRLATFLLALKPTARGRDDTDDAHRGASPQSKGACISVCSLLRGGCKRVCMRESRGVYPREFQARPRLYDYAQATVPALLEERAAPQRTGARILCFHVSTAEKKGLLGALGTHSSHGHQEGEGAVCTHVHQRTPTLCWKYLHSFSACGKKKKKKKDDDGHAPLRYVRTRVINLPVNELTIVVHDKTSPSSPKLKLRSPRRSTSYTTLLA